MKVIVCTVDKNCTGRPKFEYKLIEDVRSVSHNSASLSVRKTNGKSFHWFDCDYRYLGSETMHDNGYHPMEKSTKGIELIV